MENVTALKKLYVSLGGDEADVAEVKTNSGMIEKISELNIVKDDPVELVKIDSSTIDNMGAITSAMIAMNGAAKESENGFASNTVTADCSNVINAVKAAIAAQKMVFIQMNSVNFYSPVSYNKNEVSIKYVNAGSTGIWDNSVHFTKTAVYMYSTYHAAS